MESAQRSRDRASAARHAGHAYRHHHPRFDEDGEEINSYDQLRIGAETKLTFTRDGDIHDRKSTVVLSQEFMTTSCADGQSPTAPAAGNSWQHPPSPRQTLLLWLWLKSRLYAVERSGVKNLPVISWEELAEQMGPDFSSISNFRKSFIESAREIAAVDPHLIARVERVDQRGTGTLVRGIRPAPQEPQEQ